MRVALTPVQARGLWEAGISRGPPWLQWHRHLRAAVEKELRVITNSVSSAFVLQLTGALRSLCNVPLPLAIEGKESQFQLDKALAPHHRSAVTTESGVGEEPEERLEDEELLGEEAGTLAKALRGDTSEKDTSFRLWAIELGALRGGGTSPPACSREKEDHHWRRPRRRRSSGGRAGGPRKALLEALEGGSPC